MPPPTAVPAAAATDRPHAAVLEVVDVVFVLRLAGEDHLERSRGLIGVQHSEFGGEGLGGGQEQVRIRSEPAHIDAELRVVLLEHQLV